MSPPPDLVPGDALQAHASFVRALARGLLTDEHLAGDVAQDTLAAALEHPPRNPGRLRAYCASITRRLAQRAKRSRQRRAAREEACAQPERQPSTFDLVAKDASLREVTEAVLALDEPYREVVFRRYYEGLSAIEIAKLGPA